MFEKCYMWVSCYKWGEIMNEPDCMWLPTKLKANKDTCILSNSLFYLPCSLYITLMYLINYTVAYLSHIDGLTCSRWHNINSLPVCIVQNSE